MKTFQFVEDYIEVIAGYRDPVTNKLNNHATMLWLSFNPIISLARYDVSVLESMADACSNNKPLTTKQGDLAVKIVTKYQRQLAQKEVDITPILENPKWRTPLRVMDYSKRMYIEDDTIMLEFPFNNELIDGLRDFRKESQGKAEWNKQKRRWELELTEYNLSYLLTWGETYHFEIDERARKINEIITEVEQTPYAIELDLIDGQLTITNAAQSLIEYINEQCGGFSIDNLPKLVDMSGVLGYTISEDIKQACVEQHGAVNYVLSENRQVKFSPENYHAISNVLDYADLAQRWPVVVYESDASNKMLGQMLGVRDRSTILQSRGKSSIDLSSVPDGVKYIHTTAPFRNIQIPLLISTAGMMFGGDRVLMIQNSEKCVFFSADVYNDNKDNKVVDIESQINNS